MYFEFADRQFWDAVIFVVFGIGAVAAAVRLYQDFSRPLPPERSTDADEDTRPHFPPNDDPTA